MKKQTQAINTPYQRKDAYGALSMPVYNAVAYEFETAQEMADAFTGRIDAPDYSRVENPTVTYFENTVKALTGAENVIAFNTGMAAISNTLLTLVGKGKNVVTSRHLFGNTYSFLCFTLARLGIQTRLADLTNEEEVAAVVDENTCAIFFEILTNPQLEVADPRKLAAIAHAKNAALVADTTMIPFTQFSAKSLGIDIEVLSSTKYISGGATSLGGLVIDYGTVANFGKRVKTEMLFNLGAYMTAQVAFLQKQGLETLDARYRVQSKNALDFARAMREIEEIKKVNYVGLEDNPYHALSQELYGKTGGGMLTIDLESQEACYRFIDRLKLIRRATNLFDNRSLAIHPASTIYGLFTPKQKRQMDVYDTTIRLSIGLEDVEDLVEDVKQAVR